MRDIGYDKISYAKMRQKSIYIYIYFSSIFVSRTYKKYENECLW